MAILYAFWSMMAIGYHWSFFAEINRAAYLFEGLFLLAAAIFFVEGIVRTRVRFAIVPGTRTWLAAVLIVYSFVVYPIVSLFVTHPYPESPLFGVAPCPTTIFTLGILLVSQHPHPLLLAVFPLVWSVIGGSAAILLGVPQDWGLFVAALIWIAGACTRPTTTGSQMAA